MKNNTISQQFLPNLMLSFIPVLPQITGNTEKYVKKYLCVPGDQPCPHLPTPSHCPVSGYKTTGWSKSLPPLLCLQQDKKIVQPNLSAVPQLKMVNICRRLTPVFSKVFFNGNVSSKITYRLNRVFQIKYIFESFFVVILCHYLYLKKKSCSFQSGH